METVVSDIFAFFQSFPTNFAGNFKFLRLFINKNHSRLSDLLGVLAHASRVDCHNKAENQVLFHKIIVKFPKIYENTKPNMERSVLQKRIKIRNDEAVSLFSTMFDDTYDENSFSPDAIIKTGPEKYEFYCHRLVFAAASDFLETLLGTATPGTIPVILLPDVSTKAMQYIIMYVYFGETKVPFDKYVEFVEACKLLQLKGPINEMKPVNDGGGGSHTQIEDFLEMSMTVEEPSNPEDEKKELRARSMSVESDESEEPDMEGFLEEIERPRKKAKNRRRYWSEMLKVKESDKAADHENRLKVCVRNTYQKCRVPISRTVAKSIENSKLVMERKRLMKGETLCGLCGAVIFLNYTVRGRSLSWLNCNLSRHLKRVHEP